MSSPYTAGSIHDLTVPPAVHCKWPHTTDSDILSIQGGGSLTQPSNKDFGAKIAHRVHKAKINLEVQHHLQESEEDIFHPKLLCPEEQHAKMLFKSAARGTDPCGDDPPSAAGSGGARGVIILPLRNSLPSQTLTPTPKHCMIATASPSQTP